ncbi:hypothetical protein Z043_118036 [Scleropages formosus]|uniref:GPN-loop GTPase 2 n=1 Tax=Scleropages formosus TaxID=113540 RepID=A0A0P7WQA3_SCLFO|nr:hypothetical protein Z043_118036 [Scleropages formosus]
MLHVELPHINVLSKVDLIEQYGKLAFNLDFYTEVLDLSYLLEHLAADPFFKKFLRLNEKLAEVIQDYSLVSFLPLNVQDKNSMMQVMKAVDKANGYCFGDLEERNLQALMSTVVGPDFHFDMYPSPISVSSSAASEGTLIVPLLFLRSRTLSAANTLGVQEKYAPGSKTFEEEVMDL